ncbi:hypothetical protein [Sphingopyxis terrae]|uniref:Uncharacterized protein n=1 Tax=Sphingopyxis terrae subsp. ummariensis TaxID=429001 RepID=A0A1Y6EFH1_9SPHN|nr:hypothetical protein [Sphingopyxis terrae]PCF92929.1 hypothetical protein CPA46_01270 [Sphingopyxis terrae subsp. ummariensis]SMQ59342.1 hypothetical protein SAMN06295984_0258 [Sphingopyxis terrae subsp. ummariensis]
MKKLLSAVALVAMLAQSPAVYAGDKEPVKISGPANAKGVTTVAVGAFNVGFIFESVDQTKASGGLMGAFGGTTKAKSELVGVTPEMMQKIADAAYADFVSQLGASGYTVVPAGDLFGHAALAKTKSLETPLDINIALEKGSKGKATYFKPSELASQFMLPGDFTGSGMSSIGINMSAGQASMALTNYAKQSGVGVIDVVYLIDFSDQKRPGFFSFGGLQVNSGLSVAADYSRMTLIAPSGKQTVVTVKAPVGVEGDFIEKNDASSGTDKALQSTANVAGGLAAVAGLGGLRFGKTRKFAFTAKPGAYEEGAAKAASLASEMMVARLGAMR